LVPIFKLFQNQRIKIQFSGTNQNQRAVSPSYFKPLRELMGVFMKKPAINWWVYGWLFDFFQKQIENCGYIEAWGF
jgi:hypothetical protein